jgi:hypothetical protein
LYHSYDKSEQWICAMEAVSRQTDESVSIVPAHPETDWGLKIAHKVIQGACSHVRESKLERIGIVESRAIQKVKCTNRFGEDSLLSPTCCCLMQERRVCPI